MQSTRTKIDSKNTEIRMSTIPNAGSGLFAKKDFAKFDYVCSYEGLAISVEDANLAVDGSYMLGHTFNNNRTVVIDAIDPNSCYGRYCNDPIDLKKCNILVTPIKHRLMHNERWGVIEMLADKPIKAGDEIFFSYGVNYWMEKPRTNVLSTSQINILIARSKHYKEFIEKHYTFNDLSNKYKEKTKKRPLKPGSKQNPIIIDD